MCDLRTFCDKQQDYKGQDVPGLTIFHCFSDAPTHRIEAWVCHVGYQGLPRIMSKQVLVSQYNLKKFEEVKFLIIHSEASILFLFLFFLFFSVIHFMHCSVQPIILVSSFSCFVRQVINVTLLPYGYHRFDYGIKRVVFVQINNWQHNFLEMTEMLSFYSKMDKQ